MRWRHPERGLIPPNHFIPLAESTGLIEPLTWEVLEQSVAQAKQWHDRGWALSVSVNFAAATIVSGLANPEIFACLARHRLNPQYLTVEITEGTLVRDKAKAKAALEELRFYGVKVSIDDYGTGYSSLSYLHQFRTDELKIDMSFIKALIGDQADHTRELVKSTIDLGRRLGLTLVAEGAEKQDTVDILRELGCDLVQGWAYSPALPAAELDAWLSTRGVATATIPQQRLGRPSAHAAAAATNGGGA